MPWRRRQVTEETAVPPRRRPPLIWPWLALLLLVVAALIAAAILLTRDDDTPHVPNVVGQSTAQAVGELGDHGLFGRRPDDHSPERAARQGAVPGAGGRHEARQRQPRHDRQRAREGDRRRARRRRPLGPERLCAPPGRRSEGKDACGRVEADEGHRSRAVARGRRTGRRKARSCSSRSPRGARNGDRSAGRRAERGAGYGEARPRSASGRGSRASRRPRPRGS